MKSNCRFRMHRQVIKDLFCFEHGIFHAFGLFAGNCAQRHEDCEVDGAGIVSMLPITHWMYFMSLLDKDRDLSRGRGRWALLPCCFGIGA
jgi:hypothetical protein